MASRKSWWTPEHPLGGLVLFGAAIAGVIGCVFGVLAYVREASPPPSTATVPTTVTDYVTLQKLLPEVQISKFRGALGEEVFVNRFPNYTEYVFAEPMYFVQALTDLNDRVVLFSVVGRSKSFNPELAKVMGSGSPFKGPLLRTFAEISGSLPSAFAASVPADQPPTYAEVFWEGNPGDFLYYGLLDSSAGYSIDGSSKSWLAILNYETSTGRLFPNAFPSDPIYAPTHDAAEAAALSAIREGLTANGYFVTDAFFDFSLVGGALPGPSYQQTRLLPVTNPTPSGSR